MILFSLILGLVVVVVVYYHYVMKQRKILVLGATGNLGKVIVATALHQGYHVVTLVRSPKKLYKHDNLTIHTGDVTRSSDLKKVMEGVNAVIVVLGHGFRTSFPIQEKTIRALIPVMQEVGVQRLVTITGAALLEPGDPHSLFGTLQEKLVTLIDPYRLGDARQQSVLLRRSKLDWTIVRTPVHRSGNTTKLRSIGYRQPYPWQTVTRKAIATFMLQCLEENSWIHASPIIVS